MAENAQSMDEIMAGGGETTAPDVAPEDPAFTGFSEEDDATQAVADMGIEVTRRYDYLNKQMDLVNKEIIANSGKSNPLREIKLRRKRDAIARARESLLGSASSLLSTAAQAGKPQHMARLIGALGGDANEQKAAALGQVGPQVNAATHDAKTKVDIANAPAMRTEAIKTAEEVKKAEGRAEAANKQTKFAAWWKPNNPNATQEETTQAWALYEKGNEDLIVEETKARIAKLNADAERLGQGGTVGQQQQLKIMEEERITQELHRGVHATSPKWAKGDPVKEMLFFNAGLNDVNAKAFRSRVEARLAVKWGRTSAQGAPDPGGDLFAPMAGADSTIQVGLVKSGMKAAGMSDEEIAAAWSAAYFEEGNITSVETLASALTEAVYMDRINVDDAVRVVNDYNNAHPDDRELNIDEVWVNNWAIVTRNDAAKLYAQEGDPNYSVIVHQMLEQSQGAFAVMAVESRKESLMSALNGTLKVIQGGRAANPSHF